MSDWEQQVPQELATLSRLAEIYAHWAAAQPHVPPPQDLDMESIVKRLRALQDNRQPPDVERLLKSRTDGPLALLLAELAVVGWRLYARGGCQLLNSVYLRVERNYHPGFASNVSRAWRDVGFPDKPPGVWSPIKLL